ncbi:MAG: CpsD/CapB family tyrosine-protein kinase [Clostridium sp.]|nr:CpsD/CapB family tyrosine-protein kinase [Clostridium sp.]
MRSNKNNIIEKYRRMMNMFEAYRNKNVKCIAITSNKDIEGKTTVAKNLSLMLAKSGNKTLFVDCNLLVAKGKVKNPNCKLDGLVGILESIKSFHINDLQLKKYIYATNCEHLSMLLLGTNDLDKYSSVFKSEYLKKVIDQLEKEFEFIIIDVPSFEYLSYTQIITSVCDGCLFILKDGANEVSEGNAIREKLDTIGCTMLGCVLEKEKSPSRIFKGRYNDFFNLECKSLKKRILTNREFSADT